MGTRPQQSCVDEEDEELLGCGTTISGQSGSTSRSAGLPSSRSEQTTGTAAGNNKLNHLDIQDDDAASQGVVASKRKKRGQRAVGGDKNGRGLRQFSMKVVGKVYGCHKLFTISYGCNLYRAYAEVMLVFSLIVERELILCEKVESKGRTTYNEVADELVAEFSDPSNGGVMSPDQQQYDEKNIRRRVYDALNVLMAMDIISKDKKEIQWRGLPRTSQNDIEELKKERLGLRNRIERKAAYLQELEEQTRPHATVEVEISEDMQLVHFDFNSSPFELHDDNYVLKAMNFGESERPQSDNVTHNIADGGEGSSMSGMYQSQVPPSVSNMSIRPPTSPPLPGILKARVKQEY
ncbi:transcription factor-like protein DPB-like [Trifolium pratense]|uniref:Transcription factor-like protein DPB-like n=1 Tax=Trifolium pratense TaxID=57577 RepID=A0A2K3P3N8_TRIPR|nr:transcription factor-like protein DPB-like [Trifolium pratense]